MAVTRLRTALAVPAIAAGLLVPAGVASAATAAPADPAATVKAPPPPFKACPYFDACMYTLNGWHDSHPEHVYTYDHCFALHHEFGYRKILNQQLGGETVKGYTSGNCSGTPSWIIQPGHYKKVYITPINSISLG
jgi:hypothetical protein